MEGWVKRVKHVRNEEEASESTSNDAIVALVGRSVGGHARLGRAREKKVSWRKTTVKCGGLRLVT